MNKPLEKQAACKVWRLNVLYAHNFIFAHTTWRLHFSHIALVFAYQGAGTTSHAFYVSVFTAQGVAFQPAIEAATADQIIPMAEAGLGIGIVPEAFIRPSDNVRRIELQEPLPLRAVCIVKRKGQPLSVAARELERMLLAAGAQST